MPFSFASKVKWVRRVNERWLVHDGLNDSARAFLDHLSEVDPERYEKACTITWELVHSGDDESDPKPLFYGGLFSVATQDEADRFLAPHLFTALLRPSLEEERVLSAILEKHFGDGTLRKVVATRERVKQVWAKFEAGGPAPR